MLFPSVQRMGLALRDVALAVEASIRLVQFGDVTSAVSGLRELKKAAVDRALAEESIPEPIAMLIFCPSCGYQHVDKPEPETGWTNPPHTSHLCARCRETFRLCDYPTVGVERIETRGRRDTWTPAERVTLVERAPGDYPVFERASGMALCETCRREYWRHPIGRPFEWLHRLCDGRLVKL